MKLHFTALLWSLFCFNIYSQCSAIGVNNAEVIRTDSLAGSCTYIIQATITLDHGNASVKAFYTCGLQGQEMTLPDCFSWSNPSTQNFTSSAFSCPCEEEVYIRLVGQSNPSCGGNACGEVATFSGGGAASGQLALDLSNFRVKGIHPNQLCFTWSLETVDAGTVFFLERSMNGIAFYPFSNLITGEHIRQGNQTTICLGNNSQDPYFRLKSVAPSGEVSFSPVRHYRPHSMIASLRYLETTRQIWLAGVEEEIVGRSLMLYNTYGQMVFHERVKSNLLLLPTLPLGIYIVLLDMPGKAVVKTIRI